MLKSNPAHKPPKKPRTHKSAAAPADDATTGVFTERLVKTRAGDKRDQRESLRRRAHRLRMKEFFARANSAT
jgi:hypothetical protein